MKPIRLAALCAASLLAACSNPEASASQPASTSSTAPAKPADNEPLITADDAGPSQEDADKAAESSITEDNADAEMEKLEKELAESPGGGG